MSRTQQRKLPTAAAPTMQFPRSTHRLVHRRQDPIGHEHCLYLSTYLPTYLI